MTVNPIEPLSLKQIIAKWEIIKRRVRQKSGLLAALLNYCQVVDLIVTSEGAVVFIQVANQKHYNTLQMRGSKDIEWILTIEFNRPCFVRILSPNTALPGQTVSRNSELNMVESTGALTKQLILNIWENMKKHLKLANPLTAVYADHCEVIDIEETPEGPVVLLQVENQQYLESLQAYDRFKDIEAGLAQELGIKCRVKLIISTLL